MTAAAGGEQPAALAICPYCRQIVGAPRSFGSLWHVGTGSDAPSCCLTEHYLRQQAATKQAPQQPQQPQQSGPIQIAPQKRSGQTSPLIIVDQSRQ